jgi:hypothetical protein
MRPWLRRGGRCGHSYAKEEQGAVLRRAGGSRGEARSEVTVRGLFWGFRFVGEMGKIGCCPNRWKDGNGTIHTEREDAEWVNVRCVLHLCSECSTSVQKGKLFSN